MPFSKKWQPALFRLLLVVLKQKPSRFQLKHDGDRSRTLSSIVMQTFRAHPFHFIAAPHAYHGLIIAISMASHRPPRIWFMVSWQVLPSASAGMKKGDVTFKLLKVRIVFMFITLFPPFNGADGIPARLSHHIYPCRNWHVPMGICKFIIAGNFTVCRIKFPCLEKEDLAAAGLFHS